MCASPRVGQSLPRGPSVSKVSRVKFSLVKHEWWLASPGIRLVAYCTSLFLRGKCRQVRFVII